MLIIWLYLDIGFYNDVIRLAPIQCNWYLYKKRLGYSTHRGITMWWNREKAAFCKTKERGLTRNQPCPHLDLRPPASLQNGAKINFCGLSLKKCLNKYSSEKSGKLMLREEHTLYMQLCTRQFPLKDCFSGVNLNHWEDKQGVGLAEIFTCGSRNAEACECSGFA